MPLPPSESRMICCIGCVFLPDAVAETAKKGSETFQAILALRQQTEGKIVTLGRRAEKRPPGH